MSQRWIAYLTACLVGCPIGELTSERYDSGIDGSIGSDASDDAAIDSGDVDAGPTPPKPGMVHVPAIGGVTQPFWIDAYEAKFSMTGVPGSADQNPNLDGGFVATTVAAETEAGVMPETSISWYQANAACINAGKRLCTTSEWIAACAGPDQTIYTYDSNTHIDGSCNETQLGVDPTGSFPACTNAFGVFDMNGNVQEFTDTHTSTNCEYRGGAQDEGPASARCNYGVTTWGIAATNANIGFRCCMNGP